MQESTLKTLGYPDETTTRRGNVYDANCPTRQLLDRIGDKWSVLILLLLGEQDMRFNALKKCIGGISQKMLSQTLRSLEHDGLVCRHVIPTRPILVSYAITPLARELLSSLRGMMIWAETHMQEVRAAQDAFDSSS